MQWLTVSVQDAVACALTDNLSYPAMYKQITVRLQVLGAVKRYCESTKFAHAEKACTLERISSYFPSEACPFLLRHGFNNALD